MRVLHLFAGAGGGVLADRLLGHTSVGYVEWEPYCQEVLKARQADGCIDVAPIFGDVREFIARGWAAEYRGIADVVAGGFPCQPFSVAGKRAGSADERNMWPAFKQVVEHVRPRYVFAENVPGLLSWDGGAYFAQILKDLAEVGYGVRWTVLGADDVGAPHRRKRLWILADAGRIPERTSEEIRPQVPNTVGEKSGDGSGSWWFIDPADVADADRAGRQQHRRPVAVQTQLAALERCGWWDIDPADVADADAARLGVLGGDVSKITNPYPRHHTDRCDCQGCTEFPRINKRRPRGVERPTQPVLGRVAHGVAHRVDRLRALGNGQVPLVAATAWLLLGGPIGDR